MGSSASKAAKAAGKAATANRVRKYPKTVSTQNTTNTQAIRPSAAATPGPTVHPEVHSSSDRDKPIDLDSSDPDFQSRLRNIGSVTPNPTFSNSSTYQVAPDPHSSTSPSMSTNPTSTSQFQPSASAPSQSIFPSQKENPAVSLLTARYRLAEEAEREFEGVGRKGSEGRRFLDVVTIRQILVLRDEKGMNEGEIERALGLRRGVVGKLGGKAVVGATY